MDLETYGSIDAEIWHRDTFWNDTMTYCNNLTFYDLSGGQSHKVSQSLKNCISKGHYLKPQLFSNLSDTISYLIFINL